MEDAALCAVLRLAPGMRDEKTLLQALLPAGAAPCCCGGGAGGERLGLWDGSCVRAGPLGRSEVDARKPDCGIRGWRCCCRAPVASAVGRRCAALSLACLHIVRAGQGSAYGHGQAWRAEGIRGTRVLKIGRRRHCGIPLELQHRGAPLGHRPGTHRRCLPASHQAGVESRRPCGKLARGGADQAVAGSHKAGASSYLRASCVIGPAALGAGAMRAVRNAATRSMRASSVARCSELIRSPLCMHASSARVFEQVGCMRACACVRICGG